MVKLPPHVRDMLHLSIEYVETDNDPRLAAISICSYVEVYLEQLLAESMKVMNRDLRKRLLGPEGHLATLQAKLDIALALGLLDRTSYNNGKMIG